MKIEEWRSKNDGSGGGKEVDLPLQHLLRPPLLDLEPPARAGILNKVGCRSGDLVEVEARLAYTGSSSMSMAVEVRAGSIQDRDLQPVTHCVVVYAAVDDDGQPRAVDAWSPETPGDIALAQRVKAHIDASRAAQ